jgi:hypothetical protein
MQLPDGETKFHTALNRAGRASSRGQKKPQAQPRAGQRADLSFIIRAPRKSVKSKSYIALPKLATSTPDAPDARMALLAEPAVAPVVTRSSTRIT